MVKQGKKKRKNQNFQQSQELSRKERRKKQRKDLRIQKKFLKKNHVESSSELEVKLHQKVLGMQLKTHDSGHRKELMSQNIRLKTYKNQIVSIEKKLRKTLVNPPFVGPEKKKLPGAARPACEVYPEYYPEIYDKIKKSEEIEDLLVKFKGKMSFYLETFDFVKIHYLYALRLLQYQQTINAGRVLGRIVAELDTESKVFHNLVVAKQVWLQINNGDLLAARAIIENEKDLSVVLMWDLFFIEFISCFLLKENTTQSTVQAAFKAASSSASGEEIQRFLLEAFSQEVDFGNWKEAEAVEAEQYFQHSNLVPSNKTLLSHEMVFGSTSVAYFYVRSRIQFYVDAREIFDYLDSYKSKS